MANSYERRNKDLLYDRALTKSTFLMAFHMISFRGSVQNLVIMTQLFDANLREMLDE